MGYALVFSGQGTQHPAMLAWTQRDAQIVALERQLGSDWRERLADPAWASENRHAQPLLTGLALAAWAQLVPLLPEPDIVCGDSVGEVAAFAAAGVFDRDTALALAQQRAACMDAAAAAAGPTGLIAIGGASPSALHRLCECFDLDVAIRIDAGNAVLGGPRHALTLAATAAVGQGMRATPLGVALASHTRWMAPAAAAFERVLASLPLRRPARLLVSNALGRVRDAAQARAAMSRQIAHTMEWGHCLEAIAAQRVQAVLEIGPGHALARMWQDRHRDIPARSADEFGTAAAVAAWLGRQLDAR